MNKIEEYSIRRILSEFPGINSISEVNNIYTVTLTSTYLTLEEIEKINKELKLNNYELQKISISQLKNVSLISLIFIKNINILGLNVKGIYILFYYFTNTKTIYTLYTYLRKTI